MFQDGKQIAEKTIRVNDPLTVGGYTFHQNGFGPAPDVVIRDAEGRPLWTGPIPMTDAAAGFPFAEFAVPGRDVGAPAAPPAPRTGPACCSCCRSAPSGEPRRVAERSPGLEPLALARGESGDAEGTDFSVELRGFGEFTLLIAKRDPGQGIVWAAFGA